MAAAPAVGLPEDWSVNRRYRVAVTIERSPDSAQPYLPFSVRLDFGAMLERVGVADEFSPASVAVTRYDPRTRQERVIPHLLDEHFQVHDEGLLSWVIRRAEERQFRVYFDVGGTGSYDQPYIPLVGHGDSFRHNRANGLDPLMALAPQPISADLDMDGRIDFVSRSIYSSTWGQPWFTIWYFRNVGTNEKPVYADFVRLHADGEPIPNHYGGVTLYDWDGDGILDVVTEKTVYHNSGKLNAAGVPIMTKLADLPPSGLQGRPYAWLMGFRDHDGNGTQDLFYQLMGVHYTYEGPPPRNFVFTAMYRRMNAAPAGEAPNLGAVDQLRLNGQVETENVAPSDFFDIDGDGDLDLLGCTIPLDELPAVPRVCFWPNTATKGQPPIYGKPQAVLNGENLGYADPVRVQNAAYRGLLVREGERIRYLEQTGRIVPGQMPGFEDRGLLCQLHARCHVDGYSGVEVEDWEGDGDWDLIGGDEMGQIWLIANIGTNARPVFETPRLLKAGDEPMRVMRWHYIPDSNPEYFLGQTKPRCADWDTDGDLDIIASNNTNRMVLFENTGSRRAPAFAAATIIRLGEHETPFGWRCQPGVVDWNGDGLMDVVTTADYGPVEKSGEGRVCLFLRYRDGAELALRPGRVLLNEAGQPFNASQWEAVDWDVDGDWDLLGLVGEWGKAGPALFENVGTKQEPRFKEPVRLQCWGQAITLSAHETTFAAVDWYGTGKPDLVCGGESGWFYFFRRPALDGKAPPAARLSDKLEVRP